MHDGKSHEKIMTMQDFSLVRIPLVIYWESVQLELDCFPFAHLFFVTSLLAQLEEAKYNRLLILKLEEMMSNML